MSPHTEFDKGSLIWVKSEIEETLSRAREAMLQFAEGGGESSLRHAQTHLHQAAGALTMVDLAGLARFCEELEQAAAHLIRIENAPDSVPLLLRGLEAVRVYLDRLMAGMPNTPLLLKPLFAEIARLRQGETSGAELFFPNLQLDLPQGLPQKRWPDGELKDELLRQRRRFESGLLHWLQGEQTAAQAMAASLADVAACQTSAVARTFWWSAAAFALGLAGNRAEIDLDTRQLLMRLNLQLRRLVEGSGKVAERLFRDTLYVLAQMDCDSKLVKHLQQAFALDALIPSAAAMQAGIDQLGDTQATVLSEELRGLKETWSRIASGQHDRLPQFAQQLTIFVAKTHALPIPALDQLWDGLLGALLQLGDKAPGEDAALEMATGLLLADNALAAYPDIAPDFPQQVDALLQRLTNPQAQQPVPLLDSISRQAQERLLETQIAQEIRTNLREIEERLDAYFREPDSQRAGLSALVTPLRQVQGALLMLDRPDAVDLVQSCQQRIDALLEQVAPAQSELEDLAEALSTLGFYIDSLAQGREQPELLLPALQRLQGEAHPQTATPVLNEVLEAEPPAGQVATESLVAPAPVVPETRPLPASDAAIDAELLDVYLEEAVEVLSTVAQQLEVCLHDPADREALTLIRRGFHTLKGSGRMVGLYNLGEVAWAAEQLLNKLLQLEKPASPAVLELIESVHQAFGGWVESLRSSGSVEVEAAALIARAGQIRDGLEQQPAPEAQVDVVSEPAAEEAPEELLALAESAGDASEIVIGEIRISPTLFAIFQEEANRYLEMLQRGVVVLSNQGPAEPDFILAAHTLGGIASTTGFRSLGELSYALEQALQKLGDDAWHETDLFGETVFALDSMLGSIFQRAMPGDTPDLLNRLHAVEANAPLLLLDDEDTGITLALEEELPIEAVDEEVESGEITASTISSIGIEAASGPELPALDILPAVDDEEEKFTELLDDAQILEILTNPDDEGLPIDIAEAASLDVPVRHEEVAQCEDLVAATVVAADVGLPLEETPALAVSEDTALLSELETASVAAEKVQGQAGLATQLEEIKTSFADDIDEQLLPVFIEEADELMPVVSACLLALTENPDDSPALLRLKRTLHTMKGSARMTGAMRMGEAAHRMESRLEQVTKPGEALLDLLDNDYELLRLIFDEVSGRSVPVSTGAGVPGAEAAALPQQHVPGLGLPEPEGRATIRVKSDLVDELVNQAGEIAIARSRIEAEMLALKGTLSDLTENVVRLRSQLREIEIQAESQMQAREKELQEHEARFDPLEFDRFTRLQELTRFLAESVNDVGNVQQSLLKNLDESNAALTAQARMTRDLQQSLMRVRLVPFNSIADRLYRLARTTGKEVGKKVNLEIKGGAVEIDRGVLEKMVSPFEHMLRNAIDHGLENAPDRLASGKSEFGEIQIEVRQEGNELLLTLQDDGRGLDLARIRQRAQETGLIQPEQVLSDHELAMLIFEPGFSTADSVTQLSGRGIGMDVVKNEISNLAGRIDVQSTPGTGTTFQIRLPLSLAVTQVLLVRAGERTIAIPAVLVEQVQELKHDPLAKLYQDREQLWQGQRYPFAYLPHLLGDLARQPEQKRYSTVLLLRSGNDRLALHIDELVKNLEVVVKQIGPQLARVPGVVGGTVLGSGEIVLITNPLQLLPLMAHIASVSADVRQPADSQAVETQTLHTAPVVMVVDDSLTVRKITSRLLTREGYQVVVAKDGVDALQQMQEVRPSVMLVDIEMPRMDGFELTRNVRAAPDTRDIPIIMITSRTADKHRKVAFDLGVNVFLGKPYQEEELLGHIRNFVEV